METLLAQHGKTPYKLNVEGMTIIKILSRPAYHGYGKTRKTQVSKFTLVLHSEPIVKVI